MSKEFERPPKPKKKHHLRDSDQDTASRITRNEWCDPIGGKYAGRDRVDPRLSKSSASTEKK